MTTLAVAIGGALGAVTRYVIAVRIYGQFGIDFPWGTLFVNVAGCLMLGAILGLIEERDAFSTQMRTAITNGFIGGLTTFSTFVFEYWQFLREGDPFRAVIYVTISLVLGLLAFTAGHSAAIAAS
jgi:fluoride exporter